MKNKDAICDAFDALSKELDAKIMDTTNDIVNDPESIDIDKIENSIMDKIDKMIDSKLSAISAAKNEPDDSDQANESIIEKGDKTDES